MNVPSDPGKDPAAILVVEDSPTQADRLRYLLERHRYGVTVARDGAQALGHLGGHRPALVISDIVMPGMDGYELCRRIKSDERIADIPVILLTSLSDPEDVVNGLAAGADSFLTKPYSEEYLLSNIRQILAGGKVRKNERVRVGVEITVDGKSRSIAVDPQRMLTLLVSTYEAAVHRNAELRKAQEELTASNERLEDLVEERTAVLTREIAERKLIEEELKTSDKRFRDIADHAQEWIWEVDAGGRYTFASEVVERILGYTPEEVLQKRFFDLFHPEDRESLKTAALAAFAAKQPFRDFINRNVHKDGRTVWIVTNGLPLLDENGNLLGYRGVDTDVTERKRAEAEKEKMQAQLQQAMKMEAVGRLAGGVAHDFNNLLTVIIGNVSMAMGKVRESAPVTEMLSEVNKAAERAARLTQQLLAFSRKQVVEPKVLNINDLVADMNSMLVRLIPEDIKIRILPGKDLGAVRIDAGQFQQILVNLVVNAKDAMPGGGKVIIETSNADLDDGYCFGHPYVKPGRFVMLAVSDTGHGMSKEVKAQIFEPFFTTKAKGRGTGLGLATTYGVVKQAGGSIEVYSEVGIGTTFRIYLPRVEGEVSKPVREDRSGAIPGGAETVLLVEDEDLVRDLCVRILDKLGYKVLQAGNGDAAIALATGCGERIDLLMTDVVMPGMSGRDVADRLKQIHPEARVLFTSGYTDNAVVHHGVLDDGVSFISKPYSPSVLAKKIRGVLDKA